MFFYLTYVAFTFYYVIILIAYGRPDFGPIITGYLGFILLEVALTFIGIAAILNRAVIEKKRDIGILTAIGANKANIHFLLLKDMLKI